MRLAYCSWIFPTLFEAFGSAFLNLAKSHVWGDIHAVSDYKKCLYKKRLVEFKETKKRRLFTIYQAKKCNAKKHL